MERVREDGAVTHDWMGLNPTGAIMYDRSGNMAGQIMRDPRPQFSDSTDASNAPAEEVRGVLTGYYAYFGSYVVDSMNHTVTHRIQGSLNPGEVGTTYRRTFTLHGDTLVLQTPTWDEGRHRFFNRVTWIRAH